MKKNWDMIRLFESVNKTKIKGTLNERSITNEGLFSPDSFEDIQGAEQLDSNEVLSSYLETALWADSEDGNADFEGKTIHNIDDRSKQESLRDIEQFIKIATEQAPEELKSYDAKQLGHNLWLSRNGHGAGFFDDNNDKLQDIARNMKSKYLYVGDDQNVYIQ